MRKTLTLLCILAGIGLAAVSFFMAIPADPFGSTPKMPFASVFFILGIMLAFLSAVVYELTPARRVPHRSITHKTHFSRH
jgi:hypothetical protein